MGVVKITNSTVVDKKDSDIRIEPWMSGGSNGKGGVRVDRGGVRLVIRH